MIRSLGVVGLALLSVVGLVVTWTAATVVQLTATALIMGGTDHPLSAGGDDPGYIESYLDNAVTLFINPAAGTSTRPGTEPIDGVGTGDKIYAVTYPAEFFPVFGSQTFDSSVDAGRGNLNGCVRGMSCAYNEEVLDPPSPADPPGL
ncbi:MAG: PE-PPE domain-containing protein, partial [Mycobacterium sp.]